MSCAIMNAKRSIIRCLTLKGELTIMAITRIIPFMLLLALFTLTVLPAHGLADDTGEGEVRSETVRGKVIELRQDEPDVQEILIEVREGTFRGEEISTVHRLSGNPAQDFYFNEGERVLVWIEHMDGEVQRALVREVTRDQYLGYIVGFFILSLIAIGGVKGLKTVISLGITIFLILEILIPLIIAGLNPIPLTIIISSMIATSSVLIIGGWNRKSAAAIIGTIGGVVIAGIIAWISMDLTRLTGLSGEESQMLMYMSSEIPFDFIGLLFAGIIIGAVGAVLDIGMSIASAIEEVKKNNPAVTMKGMIKSGMNLGKDIMGTMANTLILAYTGASMSLLIVIQANNVPFSRVVNMDAIATEIVRVFAGSIGLLYAIPITAVVSAYMYRKITAEQIEATHEKEERRKEKFRRILFFWKKDAKK